MLVLFHGAVGEQVQIIPAASTLNTLLAVSKMWKYVKYTYLVLLLRAVKAEISRFWVNIVFSCPYSRSLRVSLTRCKFVSIKLHRNICEEKREKGWKARTAIERALTAKYKKWQELDLYRKTYRTGVLMCLSWHHLLIYLNRDNYNHFLSLDYNPFYHPIVGS